jgi:hypothetical protein
VPGCGQPRLASDQKTPLASRVLIRDAGIDNLWAKSALACSMSGWRSEMEGMGTEGSLGISSSCLDIVGIICVSGIAAVSADGWTGVSGAFASATWLHPARRDAKHPVSRIVSKWAFTVYDFHIYLIAKLFLSKWSAK